MSSIPCSDILAGSAPADAPVTVRGWVRTRRDLKAGISFVNVADGSSFHPVQVVVPTTLPNYADEVLHLTAGCAREAGVTGSLPSLMNAIVDALRAEGVTHIDMPATPHRVWRAIARARAARSTR